MNCDCSKIESPSKQLEHSRSCYSNLCKSFFVSVQRNCASKKCFFHSYFVVLRNNWNCTPRDSNSVCTLFIAKTYACSNVIAAVLWKAWMRFVIWSNTLEHTWIVGLDSNESRISNVEARERVCNSYARWVYALVMIFNNGSVAVMTLHTLMPFIFELTITNTDTRWC